MSVYWGRAVAQTYGDGVRIPVMVWAVPAPTSTLVNVKPGTLRSSCCGLGGIGEELATGTVHLELPTGVVAH